MSETPRRDWLEVFATMLLAFAAVATAWSSYQSTRWNGEQAKAASRTNAIRIDAARASGLAEAETLTNPEAPSTPFATPESGVAATFPVSLSV